MQTDLDNSSHSTEKLSIENLSPNMNCDLDKAKWKRSASDASFFLHSADQQEHNNGKHIVNVSEQSRVYWDLPEAVEASEAAESQSNSISALLTCQSGRMSASQKQHQLGKKFGRLCTKSVADTSPQIHIHRVHFGETGRSALRNSQHQWFMSRTLHLGYPEEEDFCRRQSTPASPFSSSRRTVAGGTTLAVPYTKVNNSQPSPMKSTTAYRLRRPAGSMDKLLSTGNYRRKYASALGYYDDEDNQLMGSMDRLALGHHQRHSTVDEFATRRRVRTSSVETDLRSAANVARWWRSTDDCGGGSRNQISSGEPAVTGGDQLKPSVGLSSSSILFGRKAEENGVGQGGLSSANLATGTGSFDQLESALLRQMERIRQLAASPLLTSVRQRWSQVREPTVWTPGEQGERGEAVDSDVLDLLDKEYEALNTCTELLSTAQMSLNDRFDSRICALVKHRGLLDTLFARLAQPLFGQRKGAGADKSLSFHHQHSQQDEPGRGEADGAMPAVAAGEWAYPPPDQDATAYATSSGKFSASTEHQPLPVVVADSKSVEQRKLKDKQIVIRSAELLSQILSYQSMYEDECDDEEEGYQGLMHHYATDEGASEAAEPRNKVPVALATGEDHNQQQQVVEHTLESTPILCQDSADANVCPREATGTTQPGRPATTVPLVYTSGAGADGEPEQSAGSLGKGQVPGASSISRLLATFLPSILHQFWSCRSETDVYQAYLAVLEPLLNQTEAISQSVVELGGLQSLVYACRSNDPATLRPAVLCLANIALFGGADSQTEMVRENVIDWLFCLGFHPDEVVQYIACLVSVILSTNTELLPYIDKAGTLEFVIPFVRAHRPGQFAREHLAEAFGPSPSKQRQQPVVSLGGEGKRRTPTSSPISWCPGASLAWLLRLVPALSSQRLEARVLAAFHFTVEAHLKAQVGQDELCNLFESIGAVEPLHQLSCSLNSLESDFAIEALRLLGEGKLHRLSTKVPSWSVGEVHYWLTGVGFGDLANEFVRLRVDGDFLLKLDESSLESDLNIDKRITRMRLLREITRLKVVADYSLQDHSNLAGWLRWATEFSLSEKSSTACLRPAVVGQTKGSGDDGSSCSIGHPAAATSPGAAASGSDAQSVHWYAGDGVAGAAASSEELSTSLVQYTYNLLTSGVTMSFLPRLTDGQLLHDCGVVSGVHRAQILSAIQAYTSAQSLSEPPCLHAGFAVAQAPVEPNDVFISYRRSNGSHLASLLRVHLNLRGYKTFMDVERLRAGKFNKYLLQWIKNSKNFLLILTQSALDLRQGDDKQQDWLHREISHALRHRVNIIPIMSTFTWPPATDLPEDIRPIKDYNAITWVHEYQDACVDRVEQFMRRDASPSSSTGNEKSSSFGAHNSG